MLVVIVFIITIVSYINFIAVIITRIFEQEQFTFLMR